MRLAPTLALTLAAATAQAGVEAAVDEHAIPAAEAFDAGAQALARAAQADCRAEALRGPYQDAFDAWAGFGHLRMGPLEEEGRALAIAFWPDPRGRVGRAVAGMVADEEEVVATLAGFAGVSVAARGLFVLERLLYDPAFAGYGGDDHACTYVRAIAADLAGMSGEIPRGWREEYRPAVRDPGAGGPIRSGKEAAQALFTGLASNAEERLGRPLGTFDDPKPRVAEARRSDRPLRNVVLSLRALRDLAVTLADGPVPQTEAAFGRAIAEAEALDDPRLEGVAEPGSRIRIEALQGRIVDVQAAVAEEIGAPLGVSVGFNAADGD